mmetsp:Transcript_41446/g.72791  ORF Transcript_41446/g.72791 Transcript_41446/m.72791 type:complete len:386 (+) Transcript_41446:82-1239(+)
MGRFTPVYDPEKTRDEQDENELRKHRQFDTPFAQLGDDLNQKRKPRDDMKPLARPSGELYQDQNKLWRKKEELFEKKKTWGRETFEWSNPEQARGEGKEPKRAPGEWHFGTKGSFGGRGEDMGGQVVQRNEVNQTMVKNEKGLWVRKKDAAPQNEDEDKPLEDGAWRCPKCREVVHKKRRFCSACDYDRNLMAEASGNIRSAPKGEDPRLEAAKQKGRGTADAAKQALQALNARRKQEKAVADEMGLTRGAPGFRERGGGAAGRALTTMNDSSQQVRPQKRLRKYKQWQGVHTTDQEAREVVEKALGSSAVGGRSSAASSSAAAAPSAAASSSAGDSARRRSRTPPRRRSRSCSWSLETSASGDSPAAEPSGGAEGREDVVVDFF